VAVKTFKPTTPTLRFTKLLDNSMLSSEHGPKNLSLPKKKNSGRNNTGKITVRHRGGGFKRRIRIVDFKRDKFDIQAKVEDLFFDPNRSANLALLAYVDGEKRYIIATKGMKPGDTVISGEKTDVLPGYAMKIKNIPSGTMVNSVELQPGKGAKIARSAGNMVMVQGVDASGKYIQVKMPSGEIRLINGDCMATIGVIGNEDRVHVSLGKAGRKRNLGWRPEVRGVVMHPAQHPHGGGEGKGVIGKAKDIYGHRLDRKTRRNSRTQKFILKKRPVKQRPDGSK
jgi:large subunit ribosomal protein L2